MPPAPNRRKPMPTLIPSVFFNQTACLPLAQRTPLWRATALAIGLALGMPCGPVQSAPASGGETVQGLYSALLSTMKNGRTLGQSGRFIKLAPVIRNTFDIATMARLSVGSSWAGLSSSGQGGGCGGAGGVGRVEE